jgi:hypothetical protein
MRHSTLLGDSMDIVAPTNPPAITSNVSTGRVIMKRLSRILE